MLMIKLSRRIWILSIMFIVISGGLFHKPFDLTKADTTTATCPTCIIEDPVVVLDTFPVDLDDLFWVKNLTKQNEVLNEICNGSIVWPITPWGAHYISSHN